MDVVITDGGRTEAGFKGRTGDCATRAIAIATGMNYRDVYDMINEYAKRERTGKRKRSTSNARTGVYSATLRKMLADLGWTWVPCCKPGQSKRTHMRADELPSGRIVCRLSKHFAAVIDGVLHDTYDCTREGNRMVYGYWFKA